VDYWYEVELNPDEDCQTIVGYDEDGAKVLRLFPEGADVNAEDIEVVGKKTIDELVTAALIESEAYKELLEKVVEVGKAKASIGNITLDASKWNGSDNLYSQVVNVEGVTENSQVDLTPSVEQLVIFHEKDLTFVTENEGGVVTVYAIGQKPENDYTIQVTISEVYV
jgi:hypothetical protein